MRTALLACCLGILGCWQSPSEKEDAAVLDATSLWQRTLGGPHADSALSGCIAGDGRLVTVGYTESFGSGGADVYLASLDPHGIVLWERTFGGPLDDSGKAVIAPRTGGLLAVGRSTYLHPDHGENSDMFLVRTDSEGNPLWERRVGGRGSQAATGVVETADGAFLVAGWTTSYGPGNRQNVYVVKATDQGNVSQWR